MTNDPRAVPLEYAAIDEAVADHCHEHQQTWGIAKRILRAEAEINAVRTESLIEKLIENSSTEHDEAQAQQLETTSYPEYRSSSMNLVSGATPSIAAFVSGWQVNSSI